MPAPAAVVTRPLIVLPSASAVATAKPMTAKSLG
jgi:hypothetical protein